MSESQTPLVAPKQQEATDPAECTGTAATNWGRTADTFCEAG